MPSWDFYKRHRGKWVKAKGKIGYTTAKRLVSRRRKAGFEAKMVKHPEYKWVTGDTQGLNPKLLAALNAVGAELRKEVHVLSGFRSREEQERLYQAYLNGTGNLAAKPGTSRHESGNAADVYVDGVALGSQSAWRSIARNHGLHFPVSGEAWHIERG